MRWWLWPFLLLLSRAAADGPRTGPLGLPATLARALHRIRESRRDVRLSDELWFEALPRPGEPADGTAAASKSPATADLLRLADAVFDTHRLSWRDALLPGMDVRVYKDRTRRYALDVTVARGGEAAGEGSRDPDTRTFGLHRRRLQLVMLPIMYKLGVITTLLTGLTVLSLKGVTIGVILLMLAVTSVATKVSRFNHYAASAYGGSPYDPFDRSSAHPIPQHPSLLQDKNIHVHVHTGPGSPVASLKGSPYEQPAPDDGAYWNRAADEYYDAAAASPYGGSGYRRPGDATESPAGGAYHRWLG